MNTELELSTAQKINALHAEVCGGVRTTIEKAIQIGGLLNEERSRHQGTWTRWVRENLKFKYDTAYRYMKLHAEQHRLPPLHNLGLQEAVEIAATLRRTAKEKKFLADVHLIQEQEEEPDARPIEDVVDEEGIKEVHQSIQAEENKEQKAEIGITYSNAKTRVIRCWKLLSDGKTRRPPGTWRKSS